MTLAFWEFDVDSVHTMALYGGALVSSSAPTVTVVNHGPEIAYVASVSKTSPILVTEDSGVPVYPQRSQVFPADDGVSTMLGINTVTGTAKVYIFGKA